MYTASAPHKIILFGEHAVVHGRLGIAGAIDKRVIITAKHCEDGIKCVDLLGINNFNSNRNELTELLTKFQQMLELKKYDEIKKLSFSEAIKIVIAATLERLGWSDVEIEIHRRDILKGIGGSAAIWAATVTALGALLGKPLTKEQINELAYLGDVVAHGGTPSGIDNSVVTYGGYISYTKATGPKPLAIKFELPLIVVDSGEPANTCVTVPYVREQLAKDPERVNAIFDNLHNISEGALVALEEKNLQRIGELMTQYYEELRKLNISTQNLDKIVNIALTHGAIGAKPTGGWGGGVCIVLAKDTSSAKELIKIFDKNNFKAFIAKLGAEGVRLEENKCS
ncbi:MAG: mevalonate kinase [Candidatus Aenigmatarchaeota archaeon]